MLRAGQKREIAWLAISLFGLVLDFLKVLEVLDFLDILEVFKFRKLNETNL